MWLILPYFSKKIKGWAWEPRSEFWPRSLDSDLGGVVKAAESFEWGRIPFILEANGDKLWCIRVSKDLPKSKLLYCGWKDLSPAGSYIMGLQIMGYSINWLVQDGFHSQFMWYGGEQTLDIKYLWHHNLQRMYRVKIHHNGSKKQSFGPYNN